MDMKNKKDKAFTLFKNTKVSIKYAFYHFTKVQIAHE